MTSWNFWYLQKNAERTFTLEGKTRFVNFRETSRFFLLPECDFFFDRVRLDSANGFFHEQSLQPSPWNVIL